MQSSSELNALVTKLKADRREKQTLENTNNKEWGTDFDSAETAWNAMSYGKVIKNC